MTNGQLSALQSRLENEMRADHAAMLVRGALFGIVLALLGVAVLPQLLDLGERLMPTATALALLASLPLTVLHIVLDARARGHEIKARMLIIEGELLKARLAPAGQHLT